ncbi:glycosyltransferase [bacterium]|nr:glycosyltransferase [bacterium]
MPTSVIIPARNEEQTIERVVNAALNSSLVDEVIVVDNASTDDTARKARKTGATVLFEARKGKGEALRRGVNAARGEIIVFIDGDLINFTGEHLNSLIYPIRNNVCHMTCCLFDRGRFLNLVHLNYLPAWTGQRALRKELFQCLSASEIAGFRVEAALNTVCLLNHFILHKFIGESLSHISKRRKCSNSLLLSIYASLKMYREALSGYIRVFLNRVSLPLDRRRPCEPKREN